MNSLVVWMGKVASEGFRRAMVLFDNRLEQTADVRLGFKYRLLLFLVLLGVVAFPQHACANTGTPLIWATGLHLFYGNALIGLGEGLLLARLFSLPKGKCVTAMIVANYASAWLGVVLIQGAIVDALPMDLNNGWMWFWVMVVATYCMTLLVEWPFIAQRFRGTQAQGWFRRSVRASLVVQSASYILLFGWYWLASDISLYTRMDIVAPADLALPESVHVYFISPADGNVYKRQLTGGSGQKIFELNSTERYDRLFVRPNITDSNRWDLVAHLDGYGAHLVDVLTNMMVEAAPERRSSSYTGTPLNEGTTLRNSGGAQRLGSATNSHWKFWAGFWPMPIEGLEASNETTGESVRFSYDTPFGAWRVQNTFHLPSDKALFQLGDDQICAFDPVRRQVALLWKGRGPVPVIEKASTEQ
ncbi:MAG TPA: hypothetical protein PLV91_03470 [Verrucomicrobiota bacterium]|jgi:hypothetical protein|nr:hypothetical protein [Verrucomicrobiota bacterium]